MTFTFTMSQTEAGLSLCMLTKSRYHSLVQGISVVCVMSVMSSSCFDQFFFSKHVAFLTVFFIQTCTSRCDFI